jgi:hypothetical protein
MENAYQREPYIRPDHTNPVNDIAAFYFSKE